tara:strand:- start:238 stop:690 length:453 start_codon:yes stop_codon:yes gene_type:complete
MHKSYLTNPVLANHIRMGVGIIIIYKNQILLEHRADCEKWGLIGGSIEIGEKVEQAAVRECYEETSLEIEKNKLCFFGIYSDINDRRIIQYPDNCFHAIDVIYKYKLENKKDIKKSKESLDIKFFPFNELPNNLVPPAISPINDFIQSIK